MSTKYVNETAAGKSVSAWIVLKRHKHVATIRAAFSNGGTCLVNVFNHGDKNKSAALNCQVGRAGGYGYDKLTAALSGLEVDGHKLSNHCQFRKDPPESGVWPKGSVAPKGWHFANWRTSEWVGEGDKSKRVELPANQHGYTSCYRESGLKYLEAIGYTVISAI